MVILEPCILEVVSMAIEMFDALISCPSIFILEFSIATTVFDSFQSLSKVLHKQLLFWYTIMQRNSYPFKKIVRSGHCQY